MNDDLAAASPAYPFALDFECWMNFGGDSTARPPPRILDRRIVKSACSLDITDGYLTDIGYRR